MVREWVSARLVWLGSFILKTAFKISDEVVANRSPQTTTDDESETDEFPKVLGSVVLTPEAIAMRVDRTRTRKPVSAPAPLDGSIESRISRKW